MKKSALIKVLKILIILIIGVIGVQTFSCSSVEQPDLPPFDGSGEISSSSSAIYEDDEEFGYCVYVAGKFCITGPFKECPQDGWVSNSCPYDAPAQSSSSDGSGVPCISGAYTGYCGYVNAADGALECIATPEQFCIYVRGGCAVSSCNW